MLGRIFAIAMNSYREAVRARVLFALLAIAVAAALFSLVIAVMSLRGETRIVADIGAAVTSFAAVTTTIVLGGTSLYRELELKTIFPILSRQLRRHEFVVGKYLGIMGTMLVFVAVDGAVTLAILAGEARQDALEVSILGATLLGMLGVALWRAKRTRSFVLLPWSLVAFAVMAVLAAPAGQERQVVLASAALTLAEVAIMAGVAMLFSSFSSPFLSAVLTFMLFLVGRSADSLAHVPPKVFGALGPMIHDGGVVLAYIVPNLGIYVPARPLLLGQLPDVEVSLYVVRAWGNAVAYAVVLLSLSSIIFRKRDFQ
jgi:ABC-type transport system involved in multi-copper enzyme maturation permease subunit